MERQLTNEFTSLVTLAGVSWAAGAGHHAQRQLILHHALGILHAGRDGQTGVLALAGEAGLLAGTVPVGLAAGLLNLNNDWTKLTRMELISQPYLEKPFPYWVCRRIRTGLPCARGSTCRRPRGSWAHSPRSWRRGSGRPRTGTGRRTSPGHTSKSCGSQGPGDTHRAGTRRTDCPCGCPGSGSGLGGDEQCKWHFCRTARRDRGLCILCCSMLVSTGIHRRFRNQLGSKFCVYIVHTY